MATTSQGDSAPPPSKENLPASSAAEVEMNTLSAAQPTQAEGEADTTAGASDASPTAQDQTTSPSDPTPTPLAGGLGPATDSPITPPAPTTTDRGPVLSITLMLTTGARHPYKIDEKYLRSRKVELRGDSAKDKDKDGESNFDPREISGYKLKELIWTDWRSEWEVRPASPSAIRLIILGRLVEDMAALKDFPFKLDAANVVHMTVKPADFLDDDDAGGKGTGKGHSIRGRDDGERGAGCRCVIL